MTKKFYRTGPCGISLRLLKIPILFAHAQCDQIWWNFAPLDKVFKSLTVYSLFGKMLILLRQICDICGLIFIVTNGQILKNNLTIWSHCTRVNAMKLAFLQPSVRNKRTKLQTQFCAFTDLSGLLFFRYLPTYLVGSRKKLFKTFAAKRCGVGV